MPLEYWVYVITYISLFSFLVFERYSLEGAVLLTKRDALYVVVEITAKLTGIILSLYATLWVVDFFAPYEIVSIAALPIPLFFSTVIAFLAVDFFHYFSHRLHHKIPLLWRFHRLHHTDKKVDVMTTFLHHPFEIISSFLVNVSCYVLLDIPVIVILVYSLVAALHAPFTHTRFTLSEKINGLLSCIIVTPNFHRVHHSIDFKEGNSNFSIVFSFWDRLFGSYCKKDHASFLKIKYGVSKKQSPVSITVVDFFVNPFK